MSINPYQPPKANLQMDKEVAVPSPPDQVGQPIGGWLFLIAIGLVVSPFRVGNMLLGTYWPLFRDGTWQQLTTPGTEAYHALWAPLLVFEIVGNLGLLVLGLIALVRFVRRSRRAPKAVIVWLAWAAGYGLMDFFGADLIPYVKASDDAESARELMRALLVAAIWIPYFLNSKRVKATFVR